MGYGKCSTVWLAKDFKYSTYVAIKIFRTGPYYTEKALDEIEKL